LRDLVTEAAGEASQRGRKWLRRTENFASDSNASPAVKSVGEK
jgi:hypothetical protein